MNGLFALILISGDPLKQAGFGNEWLTNINEIAQPEPVSFLPWAPGLIAISSFFILLALISGYKRYQRWRLNKYRRLALSQLRKLKDRCKKESLSLIELRHIPKLIRKVAIISFGRQITIPMTGSIWLEHLNKTLINAGYAGRINEVFVQLSYRSNDQLQKFERDQIILMIDALSFWVGAHTAVSDQVNNAEI